MNIFRLVSLCTFVFILLSMNGFAGEKINTSPKMLTRELKRSGFEQSELKRLSTDSVNQIYNGDYFRLLDPKNEDTVGFVYIGRVNSCRNGGCSLNANKVSRSNLEYFDYFIIFDSHAKVQSVQVFSYQSTHGQGITARSWLRQFIGYDGEKSLAVGQNIDGVSGATVSANAITADLQYKTKLLKKIAQINQ